MSNGRESRFRDDRRSSFDRHSRESEPKYSDRFARDRSPLNRRGERSPYQSGRPPNSSPPADSASRREPLVARRLSNESASRAQERSVGGNDQVFDKAVNQLYGAYSLLAERATLKLRKQELEKQSNTLSAEARTITEGRFEEYPSARELHAKRSERCEQDLKKVNSDIEVNKNNLGRSARGFLDSITKLPGASSELTVQHHCENLQQGQDELERKMNQQFAALEKTLKDQQSVIAEQSRIIVALQSQQTTLQSHFEKLKSENERTKSAVETHSTAIKPGDTSQEMEDRLSDLRDAVQNMREKLNFLDMEMIEEAVQVKECDLPALKSRIERLEGKCAVTPTQELSAKMKQLEASISQIRVGSPSKTTPAQAQQLQMQMETSISALAKQFSALVEELDSRVASIEARTLRSGLPGSGSPSQEPGEAGEAARQATVANTPERDAQERDAALAAARDEHGTPVATSTEMVEVKNELLDLKTLYHDLQTGQTKLGQTFGGLHQRFEDTAGHHDQMLQGLHLSIITLSDQFNNITTEDMCKKIIEHVLSVKSIEDQARRIEQLDGRINALETARHQPLVNGSDTANKKRKMSAQTDIQFNGQH